MAQEFSKGGSFIDDPGYEDPNSSNLSGIEPLSEGDQGSQIQEHPKTKDLQGLKTPRKDKVGYKISDMGDW